MHSAVASKRFTFFQMIKLVKKKKKKIVQWAKTKTFLPFIDLYLPY